MYTPGVTNETNINNSVLGTLGMNKAGFGTLTLSQPQYYTGQTTINQGTLKLNAGTNTIAVPVGTSGQPLGLNAGGTLDLNGNVQVAGTLSSDSAASR